MLLDGHIHMHYSPEMSISETQRKLINSLKSAGFDGGLVISLDPKGDGSGFTPEYRINQIIELTQAKNTLYPVYWINPIDENALDQVDMAIESNICGFKVICGDFYPSDQRAMAVYNRISAANKPILFHSGILWDGRPSSKYNRPGEFECLLDVANLRFTLAHISWPWCDECIAVYGKFNNAYASRPGTACEMFIDVTPGTPLLWREEVFKKLFLGDYDVVHNVIFGTDCNTTEYNTSWARKWIDYDNLLYNKMGLIDNSDFLENIYKENLLRFLGKSNKRINKKIPRVAE